MYNEINKFLFPFPYSTSNPINVQVIASALAFATLRQFSYVSLLKHTSQPLRIIYARS